MSSVPSGASNPLGYSPNPHKTYASLVQGDMDLVGHIAYAFYKRDKLKFCDAVRTQQTREPTQQDVDAFIQTSNIDTRLQGYRNEAEILLERFTEFQLEEAVEEIRRQSTEELATKLSEGKSWPRAIAEALVGSFFVAAMWALLVVVLYANKVGVDRIAKDIFEADLNGPVVTHEAPAAPAAPPR